MKDCTNINGYRFQFYTDTGIVHIHDDKNNIKFVKNSKEFKKELEEALNDLGRDDGLVEIKSDSGPNLYVWSIGTKTHFAILFSSNSLRKDFNSFLQTVR